MIPSSRKDQFLEKPNQWNLIVSSKKLKSIKPQIMPKTEAMYDKEQKIKMMAFSLVQNMQRLTLNLYHLPELRA